MSKKTILSSIFICIILGFGITYFVGNWMYNDALKGMIKNANELVNKNGGSFMVELPNYKIPVGFPKAFRCAGNWCDLDFNIPIFIFDAIIIAFILFLIETCAILFLKFIKAQK